jgi:hypothetical protein
MGTFEYESAGYDMDFGFPYDTKSRNSLIIAYSIPGNNVIGRLNGEEEFKLKEKEMKNLCISGSYGTMAFKLKRWQQKLNKIACEYMVPYRI